MAQAKQGDKVKIHYTGKFVSGEVFDSTEGKNPLVFVLGEGHVIPGFDKGVEGLEIGEKTTLHIKPEQAYGVHHSEMVMEVDKKDFPQDLPLNVGQNLELGSPDGRTFIVTISAVDEESITLDGNHPLAGKELVFDVELVSID